MLGEPLMSNSRNKSAFVVVVGLAFLLSGIAGVAVGGTSALAGWWLVVVGSVLVVLAAREIRTARTR
jgi:hypothetical protein